MYEQSSQIVVGVDFSSSSGRAARWAAEDAARRHVVLVLLHAEPLPTLLSGDAAWSVGPEDVVAMEQQARSNLADLAETLRSMHPGLAVETQLARTTAVDALLAKGRHDAMLVVGSSGMSAIDRVLVGSVGLHVSHEATAPVVVVRGRDDILEGPVVVGVDGSPASTDAVSFAFDEAAMRRTPLRVVHARNGIFTSTNGLWSASPSESELEVGAQLTISESIGGWAEKFPDVEVDHVVVNAHPVEVLHEESKTAQLLVVGSHGRRRLARMLMGSVAHEAVSHALCPVAVVHPREQAVAE